jgi:hypothetical protein
MNPVIERIFSIKLKSSFGNIFDFKAKDGCVTDAMGIGQLIFIRDYLNEIIAKKESGEL